MYPARESIHDEVDGAIGSIEHADGCRPRAHLGEPGAVVENGHEVLPDPVGGEARVLDHTCRAGPHRVRRVESLLAVAEGEWHIDGRHPERGEFAHSGGTG